MKKIVTCIAFLIVANSIYSQQSKPTTPLTKKDYLQKSKNQKTAAWLFMGGGLGLTTLGLTTEKSNDNNSGDSPKIVAIVTGLAAISTSIALFIASSENKKRAESLSFRLEKAPQIQQGSFVYRSFPVLSFRLNL